VIGGPISDDDDALFCERCGKQVEGEDGVLSGSLMVCPTCVPPVARVRWVGEHPGDGGECTLEEFIQQNEESFAPGDVEALCLLTRGATVSVMGGACAVGRLS
jgi:hypothetical protein